MTEKEINKLSEAIAESVFQKLCKRQEEWDNEFLKELQDQGLSINIVKQNEEEIEDQIIELEKQKESAVAAQDYKLAGKLHEQINKLKNKLDEQD